MPEDSRTRIVPGPFRFITATIHREKEEAGRAQGLGLLKQGFPDSLHDQQSDHSPARFSPASVDVHT